MACQRGGLPFWRWVPPYYPNLENGGRIKGISEYSGSPLTSVVADVRNVQAVAKRTACGRHILPVARDNRHTHSPAQRPGLIERKQHRLVSGVVVRPEDSRGPSADGQTAGLGNLGQVGGWLDDDARAGGIVRPHQHGANDRADDAEAANSLQQRFGGPGGHVGDSARADEAASVRKAYFVLARVKQ